MKRFFIEIKKTDDYFEFKNIPAFCNKEDMEACFEQSEYFKTVTTKWSKFDVKVTKYDYYGDGIYKHFYEFFK